MTKVYEIREGFDFTSALPDLLAQLPQWRMEQALRFRKDIDRFLCAKSFLMLEEMLRERWGQDLRMEFSYGSNGKPYLCGHPDIFFSISHCSKGIACAVSDSPVGVDIEEIQYDRDVACQVLNAGELAELERSEEPDVCFTVIWTRKESYLKLTGEGLRDNMKDVLPPVGKVRFETEVNRPAAYVLTLAQSSEKDGALASEL